MKQDNIAQIEELSNEEIKLLVSFIPDKPVAGLDPTFYHTLTYKGDLELYIKLEIIRNKLTRKREL